MTTLLLAFALICPPDGVVQQSALALRAYTAPGVRVWGAPVPIGTTLRIEADLLYLEWDYFGQRSLAFQGGQLLLRINGEPVDITPTNGIPILGPAECGGSLYCATAVDYQITNCIHAIVVEYRYASCTTGCNTSSVSAVLGITVSPTGPLSMTKSEQSVTLSFWGLEPSYEVQASDDMANWGTVGNVEPEGGKATWTTGVDGAAKMFRVRVP